MQLTVDVGNDIIDICKNSTGIRTELWGISDYTDEQEE